MCFIDDPPKMFKVPELAPEREWCGYLEQLAFGPKVLQDPIGRTVEQHPVLEPTKASVLTTKSCIMGRTLLLLQARLQIGDRFLPFSGFALRP